MLDRFEPRERLFIVGGGVIVAIVLVIFLGRMIIQQRSDVASTADRDRQAVESLYRLRSQIRSLSTSNRSGGPAPRDTNVLMSNVDNVLNDAGLEAQSIRPERERIEAGRKLMAVKIRLQSVALPDLVDFLRKVEQDRRVNAQIHDLYIQRIPAGARERYSVDILLVAQAPAEAE